MASPLAAISYNFKNLTRFSGRDDRATFWPYAGAVIALAMAGMLAIMLPEFAASIARMQKFAAENPELATVSSGPGHYSITIEGHHPELMPDMRKMMGGFQIVLGMAVLLLGAAVARRLHDSGRSGWWGLMPLPFFGFAAATMPKLFAEDNPDTGMFFAVFFNNLLYLVSLATLVILLAKPSRSDGNSEQQQGTGMHGMHRYHGTHCPTALRCTTASRDRAGTPPVSPCGGSAATYLRRFFRAAHNRSGKWY